MTVILVVWITFGTSVTVTTAEFKTVQKCEFAGQEFKLRNGKVTNNQAKIETWCMEK
jgi:hypothetical protein